LSIFLFVYITNIRKTTDIIQPVAQAGLPGLSSLGLKNSNEIIVGVDDTVNIVVELRLKPQGTVHTGMGVFGIPNHLDTLFFRHVQNEINGCCQ
jgi:hypothetical protein